MKLFRLHELYKILWGGMERYVVVWSCMRLYGVV